MGKEEAFLKAITDAPADVALRLVYADWLEERVIAAGAEDGVAATRAIPRLARLEYARAAERGATVAGTTWRDPTGWSCRIDEADGTVLRSQLDALDTGVEAHITVTYQKDDAIGLFVPARMEERYRRPRDSFEVHGVATYSRFRRFQVSTSEELVR